jgi:zinc-ribbon domain
MDLGSIFLILGLLVLVALFIGRPFLEPSSVEMTQEEHEHSSLLAERDRVLNALMELDFDHTLGKIPEEDFPVQRAALMEYGVQVLKNLDAFQTGPVRTDVENRLEAAIASRRADAARGLQPAGNPAAGAQPVLNGGPGRSLALQPDDDLEAVIASRRRERPEIAGGFCPGCGRPVQKTDRFCPKCGTKVGV